jgi:microsomal dipeptidase-like Zn-dependent dipeptidase
MNTLKRKDFLKKTALLVSMGFLMPKFSMAKTFLTPEQDDATGLTPIDEDAIIDLHCHPSMKMNLLNYKIWTHHHPIPGPNMVRMQENTKELSAGYVKGMIATHYLIEASVEKEWDMLKKLLPWIKRIFVDLVGKVEHEDPTNFDQTIAILDKMEHQIAIANQKQNQVKFVIATDFKKFEQAMTDGFVPLAHSIEGAHALGRNFPISIKRKQEFTAKYPLSRNARPQGLMVNGADNDDATQYIKNLKKFKERGVCLITLSHFFQNDLSYPVDGISADEKKGIKMAWEYTPDKNHPLTEVGKAVVKSMLDIGVIVDMTHSTPAVRQGVFEINRQNNADRVAQGKLPRPLVFTHVGAQAIYDYYDQGHYPYYKFYNVSDEEIDLMSECNGVIGVIPENFWLVGADTHLKKEFQPFQFQYGIPYIVETMKYINAKTRTKKFDNIGIGTDFDGLADNPKDLYKASLLGSLITALKTDPDIGPEYTKKITSQNAERLLKYGWGG